MAFILSVACVAAVSFPFPNAREREENCERVAHPRRAPSLTRFSFACSISVRPEKGKESAATQAILSEKFAASDGNGIHVSIRVMQIATK